MAINLEAMRAKLNASKNGVKASKTIRSGVRKKAIKPFVSFHQKMETHLKSIISTIMWERIPESSALKQTMEKTVLFATLPLNFGEMEFRIMTKPQNEKQRSCLYVSVITLQSWFVGKKLMGFVSGPMAKWHMKLFSG